MKMKEGQTNFSGDDKDEWSWPMDDAHRIQNTDMGIHWSKVDYVRYRIYIYSVDEH